MSRYEAYTDDQLISAFEKKANEMSYFNAAEGDSWRQETAIRSICQHEFRQIREEIVKRGLDFPQGNWLI